MPNVTPDQEADTALRETFKLAMRRLAATVTIITANGDDGAMGMTATAVTSLSAEPPALLVCVNRSASIHAALAMGKPLCVNLLSEHHGELSFSFGGKSKPQERFQAGPWSHDENAVPFLMDAQANIFCLVDSLFEYATHSIVIGKIRSIRLEGDVRPLIYGDGRFIPLPPLV
jgi:flavin reductase (DIM6/NTAB) family NADH-FMN oxidoreductase RutF